MSVLDLTPPPMENVDRFFTFINERHAITLKRQAGDRWPWTADEILQKYRFCNVFRELDTVTIWIRENWRQPYANHPNLWFAMAVARQINWPPTLAEIGFPEAWRPRRVSEIIRNRREEGKKAYTSAYMLTGTLGGDKASQTVDKILTPLYRNPPPIEEARTLQDAFDMFKGRPGFGPFLAYEVVTDLRHTRYLRDALDINRWANAGPGAIRGLNRLWNRPFRKKRQRGGEHFRLSPTQAVLEMRLLLMFSRKSFVGGVLEMRDIEHSLCEWDKYERVRMGEGTLELYQPLLPNLLS